MSSLVNLERKKRSVVTKHRASSRDDDWESGTVEKF